MARTAVAKQQPIDTTKTENTADIHHMVNTIAATNSPDQVPQGAYTVDQADARLRTWLEQGYKLHTAMSVQPGEVNGIFTLQVLYILIRD